MFHEQVPVFTVGLSYRSMDIIGLVPTLCSAKLRLPVHTVDPCRVNHFEVLE